MSDLFGRYLGLLKGGGTNRLQRTLPALEDGYVRPDERHLPELLDYARALARELRFYNLSGQASGDWRGLLEPLADPAGGPPRSVEEWLAASPPRQDWPPHLALFLTFLHLFENLQNDSAELPRRHLRHYLEQVLALRRRPAAGDAVHVLFELAKSAAPIRLPPGTLLDAGKDPSGRPLSYATRGELTVSAARIAEIRRLVAETDDRGVRRYFLADALSAEEAPSWQTFGLRQLPLDPGLRRMREAEIGFAVASPILRLAEGARRVTVRAFLHGGGRPLPPPQAFGFGLLAALTGAEGWLVPDELDARLVSGGPEGEPADRLEIRFSLAAAAPAVVPFAPALHGAGGPDLGQPLLRCLVRGGDPVGALLAGLAVDRFEIEVAVQGLRGLTLQNDEGALAAGAPAPPFGSQPRPGSRFYLGSAEAFGKNLKSLAVRLTWQDPPADFFAHYKAYFDRVDANLENGFQNLFVADVDLLAERSFAHPLLHRQLLFAAAPAETRTLRAGPEELAAALGGGRLPARPGPEPLGDPAAGAPYGFLRLTLRGPTPEDLRDSLGRPYAEQVPYAAFGHQAFGRRFAAQAIALAQHPGDGSPKPELPSEPYTPLLAEISLDYEAATAAVAGDRHAADDLLVIEPWGFSRARALQPARLVPDLDPLNDADPVRTPFAAGLFLGLEGFSPPGNLSLLFQIDAGTASADEALAVGETEWSELTESGWRVLPAAALLEDATLGFQQPGLVVLTLSRDAGTRHTEMPAGLAWLRARIRRSPESAARTRGLHAHAALADRIPAGPASGEAAGGEAASGGPPPPALPAGAISRLRQRHPAIKKVLQPYPSFGGRAGESDAELSTRAAERLRHRRRAITGWDLERLVLDAFPEVFKVKALPCSDAAGQPRAGEAAVVIVPDLRGKAGSSPLEPRAGVVLLESIAAFLRSGLATPFATLHVIQPVYERLVVDARVAFRPGRDPGYHAALLDRELQRFLSPWAFEEGRDIVFGGRIYRSEVLAFVEGRDYVDFVLDFSLYHRFSGPPLGGIGSLEIGRDFLVGTSPRQTLSGQPGGMTIGRDFVVGKGVEVAEATRPHAILVSHPAHRITPIDLAAAPCAGPGVLGIGYLTVGLDFEVFHS